MKKLIVLLLALSLLVLVGCNGNSGKKPAPTEPTTPPPTTLPPPPPAAEVYNQARQAMDDAQNITLDVTVTQYTTVNEDEFSERSVQVLSYQGLGTGQVAADMDAKLYYSVHSEGVTQEELEETAMSYRETFTDGTLYVLLADVYKYQASSDAESALARYTPAVLLDAALYGDISYGEADQGTKLVFTQPTAGESWAIPEEAVMTDASGSVMLNEDGAITQMDYTLTYSYGPAEIRLEVCSVPKAEAVQVATPEKADSYAAITDIDAAYMATRAQAMLAQADAISTESLESVFSQAAGFMRNQSIEATMHGRKENTQAKMVYSIYATQFTTGESQQQKQEVSYVDGKYTTIVNDGLPTSQSGVDWETVRDDLTDILYLQAIPLDFCQNATITDMGSVYLLEYQLNENFGNSVQNSICSMLWNDPSFLYSMASKYETGEVTGYLSIDKFTGVAVAGGYFYEGIHTIEGRDYSLTMQFDQSL